MAASLSSRLIRKIFAVRSRICHPGPRYFSQGRAQPLQGAEISSEHVQDEEADWKDLQRLAEYRFVFPEFLPNPNFEFRNKIREKLERQDMLKRRSVIDIPEFYVGSVLAVTASDPYAPGKENRFVGICIARTYCGLRATFTLRNIVDKQGVEIMYDLYNPTIQKIEVLRLEKRLDDELYYLRDAPPEYSTFPFDMEPEYVAEGQPIRINPMKVPLKPKPWHAKWQLFDLKGVEPFDHHLGVREKERAIKHAKPWEKYDLMKQYRKCVPEEDQQEIWEEVHQNRSLFQQRKQKWKQRILQRAPEKK